MIFQAVIVLALALLVLYAYFQWRRAPVVSLAVFALAVIGIVLAMAPDLATSAAHMVGIGRGADLVIYCFVLIALGAIFNLHIKLRASEDNLTRLVRTIALLEARLIEDGDHGGSLR